LLRGRCGWAACRRAGVRVCRAAGAGILALSSPSHTGAGFDLPGVRYRLLLKEDRRKTEGRTPVTVLSQEWTGESGRTAWPSSSLSALGGAQEPRPGKTGGASVQAADLAGLGFSPGTYVCSPAPWWGDLTIVNLGLLICKTRTTVPI
jgi:hypothetical protein